MTLRRHLRRQAKLSGRNPDDLIVKTALSVFRDKNEYERFMREAGIREDQRFDALSAIVTLRSRTNETRANFASGLASYFKLTNLAEADRLSLITYSVKYKHYLDIPHRDIAFDGYEWAASEDIDAVFSLTIRGTPAEYIRDLRLYDIEEGVNDTSTLLDADLAYRGGVPADLYRKLRSRAPLDDIIAVNAADVPTAFAEAALLSGATAAQAITAHQRDIPLEYATAL